MIPVEFAAIEARASAATLVSKFETSELIKCDIPALLAAVRERDNTIARIRAVLDDYDGLDAEPIPKLSTHAWMHVVGSPGRSPVSV